MLELILKVSIFFQFESYVALLLLEDNETAINITTAIKTRIPTATSIPAKIFLPFLLSGVTKTSFAESSIIFP